MRFKLTQIFSSYALILPGRIIVPPVTQLLRSKWLNCLSLCTERKNWVIFWHKKLSHLSWVETKTFKLVIYCIGFPTGNGQSSFRIKCWSYWIISFCYAVNGQLTYIQHKNKLWKSLIVLWNIINRHEFYDSFIWYNTLLKILWK